MAAVVAATCSAPLPCLLLLPLALVLPGSSSTRRLPVVDPEVGPEALPCGAAGAGSSSGRPGGDAPSGKGGRASSKCALRGSTDTGRVGAGIANTHWGCVHTIAQGLASKCPAHAQRRGAAQCGALDKPLAASVYRSPLLSPAVAHAEVLPT